MEKLPPEIAFEIFYRLSPESVVQCKLVCKSWYSLLPHGDDGNYFANMHLRRQQYHQQRNLDYSTLNFISLYKFRDNEEEEGSVVGEFHITEYDEVEGLHFKVKELTFSQNCISGCLRMTRLVGSCNGLLCLTIDYQGGTNDSLKARTGICNPLLHEYVTLPLSDLQLKQYTSVVTGFGHNPITDEYKVVRVYYSHSGLDVGDVEVYTLGKSSNGGAGMWRSKGTIHTQCWTSPYVVINGSIHWLTDPGIEQNIVSFDLENEDFGVIPLPSNLNNNTNMSQLRELRGCLCFIGETRDVLPLYLNRNLDIWVLKDYMNKESWVKEFSIKLERGSSFYSPCAIKKKKDGDGDEILCWSNGKRLFSYDPKTQNFKEVRDRRFFIIERDLVLHINSLVSLKALGEDAKESSEIKDIIWAKRMKKGLNAFRWV